MSFKRFTFCVPNLNKARFLPSCVESMLNQDSDAWRCVFVDGYSTDGSWEWMKPYASDPRFKVRRGTGAGMYADWNECLKHVDTDYFYFLPSDDTCKPDLVSTTVRVLDHFQDVEACHFQYDILNEKGGVLKPYREILRNNLGWYEETNQFAHRRSGLCEFFMHFVFKTIYTTMTSLVFRRTLLDKLKGFPTVYGSKGDYDWTMRLGWFTDVIYIPRVLASWRKYEGQATAPVPSVESYERLLTIGRSNLEVFLTDPGRGRSGLRTEPNPDQILSWFNEEYADFLYSRFYVSKTAREIIGHLSLYLKKHPAHIFKKAASRLARGSSARPRSGNDFARQLIRDYGLPWPPVPIEEPTG